MDPVLEQSFVRYSAFGTLGSQPTFAACCTKVHCGPFVSFDTKGRQSQMLRHAHFYIKGGERTFATIAKWSCVNGESRHSISHRSRVLSAMRKAAALEDRSVGAGGQFFVRRARQEGSVAERKK
jgi:hypothetical protein